MSSTPQDQKKIWVAARLGLIVLITLTACDPEVRLHGRLTSTNGQPIKVGEIRIACPELCTYALVRGDRGDFYGSQLGRGCSLTCKLRVGSVGYRDFVAPAARYCIERDGSTCSDFEANITLEPSQ